MDERVKSIIKQLRKQAERLERDAAADAKLGVVINHAQELEQVYQELRRTCLRLLEEANDASRD